jgi:adenosine receptor A2b
MKHKKEVRAANTLAMIVGTFLILWLPGILSLFIMAITKNRDFHIDILELSTILVHLNSAIDPIIYAYRMRNIREALNQFFKCCKRSNKIHNQSSLSSNENRSNRTSSIKTTNS